MENLNWISFLERKGLSKSDAARLLGAAPAMMTEWMKGKANPTYKYLKKLCKIGMTAQEMFGDELGGELVKNSSGAAIVPPPEIFNDPAFQEGIKNVVEEILKSNGTAK